MYNLLGLIVYMLDCITITKQTWMWPQRTCAKHPEKAPERR